MQCFLLGRARAAHARGACEALEVRGRVRALHLLGPAPGMVHGVPTTGCLVVMDRRGRRPRQWLEAALRAHGAAFGDDLYMELDAAYAALLEPALDQGLHVDSVVLLGRPGRALAGLRSRPAPPPEPASLGLVVTRLATEAQVDAVIALKRAWFSRHPEFGWFCADEHFLASERQEMLGELTRPGEDAYVLLSGGAVQGYLAFTLEPESPSFGRLAHVDLTLAPELQGRGLSVWAYTRLVERMRARRVDVFKGGTSQGPVLHLSRLMGRTLQSWCLRRGEPRFPQEHFDVPLPRRLGRGW